jgi:acetyl esterase/lipase
MIVTALAALLTPAAAALPPAKPAAIRETFNIRYHHESPRQVLDVFSPADVGSKKSPVVVFVHGGTWMVGDKDFYGINRGAGRMLARSGCVAVLPNYRLSPSVRHPEHARDVARAIAWAVKNAEKHGGDPGRIILAGHSAGGHLVSLVASDPSYLEDPALGLGEKGRRAIKGVIGLSGVYRIPDAAEFAKIAEVVVDHWKSSPPGSLTSLAAPVLGMASPVLNPFLVVFGPTQEAREKASPVRHVRKGLPPFLLLYAEYEPPTVDEMSREYARALLGRGVPAELKYVAGASHRGFVRHLHDESGDTAKRVLEFIARATR